MEVKEAIGKAKQFAASVLSDEHPAQIRLEEVEYDDSADAWLVTLGVLRPDKRAAGLLADVMTDPPLKRSYKVIRVPNDAKLMPSMKIRVFDEAD